MLQARYSSNENERPQKGWFLEDYTDPDNIIPIVSSRNRPLKYSNLEKMFSEIQKRSPRKEHCIKVLNSAINLEGTVTLSP